MDYQGGDGGGFATSNDGAPSPSQGGGQRTRRSYDEQTLIPVTIQMAMNAQPDVSGGDGSLVLQDGRPVSTVKIVGAVRSCNEQSTNVLYQLEDGTGLMDVKQWVDDNDCTAILEIRKETLKENMYVKAIGQIKDYDGKKMIVANMVRPLTTGNELTHHFLEVAYSGERSKRASSIVAPAVPANNGVGFGAMAGAKTASTGNPLADEVLKFIREKDCKLFLETEFTTFCDSI
jgi:replication factor A2